MFNHEKLFTAALQLQDPLYVENVVFEEAAGELHIYINFHKGGKFKCAECGAENLNVHDTVDKVWRHLNFFQYKAFIHFRTPRTICPEHGVRMVRVPWAAPGSGFTLLFEALVHVVEGKDEGPITSFKQMLQFKSIKPTQITDFSADMSIPFRKGITAEFPWTDITFDKFHVIKLLNEALDRVRRQEQSEESILKYSRYLWLSNVKNLKPSQKETLMSLSQMNLKTARAQSARNRARGYRNVKTFTTMIYLLGGRLNPEIKSGLTHSI